MKRLVALLLCAAVLGGCAWAEEVQMILPEAEDCAQIVEALLGAAAGTDYETEKQARKGLSDEEILLRDEQNALYRAQTLPWLKAALSMAQDCEDEEEAKAGQDAQQEEYPVWTVEDSFAAMQANPFGRQYIECLRSFGAEEMETCLHLTQEAIYIWQEQINHAELLEMNEDYAFWIYAPFTQIDYPVVHAADNEYYLNKLFDRSRNAAGTLFVDYRNLSGLQDPNTLIYGHHMRNKSMFGALIDYGEQAFFEAHPYFLVLSEGELCLMEIYAGYTTSDQDHCYDIAISDEDDMLAFVEEAKLKSDFTAQVVAEPTDRMLTLSTCAYAFRNARYIVIGRLERMWRQEGEEALG